MKHYYLAALTASTFTLERNLEGLTQEQSLLQPPNGGNCINWNAGHILATRQQLLSQFGVEGFLTPDETKHYVSGSRPMTAADMAVDIARLKEGLSVTHGELQEKISAADDSLFANPIPAETIPVPMAEPTFGKLLAILIYHEGYHAGQTGLGRRIIGVNFKTNL